ncbi:KPN_02809 family neutral zinc metallopeptidase [Chelatococcus asaccharovorans]|uniref:KPN_02809 family neutral zinc metallopeptidase n=1 Tax=Chelatococcus asaccharovorans TaxID=28210 RepID=UPI00224C735D|nr:neutral zinc metallopeptidase [Chelatococcus asaccharovorans]CAH1666077.1 conserved hypothetical protein [Chelatococcus asaccharovorans]CAH1681644.1 conserved hypothetical protein [Chelatococcus asaccharovorans]
MRWDDFRRSDNVEDRRGGGGGGFRVPTGGRGGRLGIGTIVVLGLLGWALGIDPRLLITGAEMLSGGSEYSEPAPQQTGRSGQPQDRDGQFASAILGNTEDVWKVVLPQQVDVNYQVPRMVLFSGGTRSGCGIAQSATGPFYCPLDRSVYLDLDFFREMRSRFNVSGDFAYAYVIAHEVGHHVQNLLGILPRVQEAQRQASQAQANQLSVRVELMADCLAGVWASHSDAKYRSLEPGDVEAAMNAASAIGDDRLQKASQGYAVPESFTHGSSEQRVRWFTTGLKSGKVEACNTLSGGRL